MQSPLFSLRTLLCTIGLVAGAQVAWSQNVGIGTATPDPTAVLDVTFTPTARLTPGKGLLIPRCTKAQREAIGRPATALLVYQTDGVQPGFWYNAGDTNTPDWTFLSADNLGNGVATTDVNLGAHALVGTGISIGTAVGLGVRADGGLNIGENTNGNVFMGYQTGLSNTSGADNVFIGNTSGYLNSIGRHNLFVGTESGRFNLSGEDNLFMGFNSGRANSVGSYNLFLGTESGKANLASSNQFMGYLSGTTNTTGSDNLFLGYQSGIANNTGSGNLFIGPQSGSFNKSGDNNWGIGVNAGPDSGNLHNAGALGFSAYVSQSNSLVLGAPAGSTYAVKVGVGTATPAYALDVVGNIHSSGIITAPGFSSVSDRRFKQDIATLPNALAQVRHLRGVRYTFRQKEFADRHFPTGQQIGVIAQELEQVFPELVSTGPDGYKAVNYAQLTPVLLEAIKELAAQNEALKTQVAAAHQQAEASTASFGQRLQALEAAAGAPGPARAQARP